MIHSINGSVFLGFIDQINADEYSDVASKVVKLVKRLVG